MSDEQSPGESGEYERVGDMVSIFQRGRVWYANYQTDGRQKRQSLKTRSKKEARVRALRLEAKLSAGPVKKTAPAPMIGDVIDAYMSYLRTEGRAAKTMVKYKKVLERVQELAARRQARTILDVNLQFADAYRAERRAAEVADKTLFTETTILRQLVNYALSRWELAGDPLKGLKLPKPKPRPQPCWTRDQVEAILTASQVPQKWAFTLLAETGMRFGELQWLTWEDVNLKGEIPVVHVRAKDEWKPKTGDQRAIPISTRARQVLESLPRKHRWVLTAAPSRKYPDGGRQISERRLLVSLKRVLARLGLKGHLHTFRHAFISNALLRGISEAVVRKWVGHVDAQVMRLYTHIIDKDSQAAMQRLNEADQKELQKGGQSLEQVSVKQVSEDVSAQTQHTQEDIQNV